MVSPTPAGASAAGSNVARDVSVAVITMARDEAFMLPRWVEHYGRQVGLRNLVVLDDNSADGSTDDLPCTVYRVPPPPWENEWGVTRERMVNNLARGLLACNDVVIFTDTDELLVPDPAKYRDLRDYLTRGPRMPITAPLTLELVHNARLEPALEPGTPMLRQRSFVKFSPGMCKPLVKRVGRPWRRAFHATEEQFSVDPDLWMFHLKWADEGVMHDTAENRRALHEDEGRGHPLSFWPMGGPRLRELLADWTDVERPDEVPEFDAADVDVSDLVVQRPGGWWQSSAKQVNDLADEPVRRVPARFRDVF